MIQHRLRDPDVYWPVLGALTLLAGLCLVNVPDYILFHSLAEIFAIVIACAVFTLAWNTRHFLDNGFLLFVGIALLAASAINVLHVLAYKGMGVFGGQDADLATQLWLARRYLESIALLSAALFVRRRLNPLIALFVFGGVTAILLGAIFLQVFPVAYIEGVGLTPFKKVSEYVIAGLFVAAAYAIYRQRSHFEPDVWPALVWALIISAGAELLFTLYLGVYDLPNRLGHFLTICSYFLIYLAIVKTGIVRPYALLSTANASLRSEVSERQQAQSALVQQSQRLRSLHEIDRAILRAQSPSEIAGGTVRSLVKVTGARWAGVVSVEREAAQLELLAAYGECPNLPAESPVAAWWLPDENRHGETGMIRDATALPDSDPRRAVFMADGIRCYSGVPLVIAGQAIGAILLAHSELGPLPEEVLEFAGQVADQLAVAIRQAQLFDEITSSREQLRTLSHRLVALQEEERKGLSRELHDRAGQSITALQLRLGVLRREADGSPDVQAGVDDLSRMADGIMEELHQLAVSLRPASLDRYGLAPALAQYLVAFQRQHSIEIDFMPAGLDEERLPDDIATALYRIVQESLTNVVRHSGARHAGIVLSRTDGTVRLIVEDDGCGFDVEEALGRGRLGLLGMRERAEMLGGAFTLESQPGAGTTLFVEVPWEPGAPSPG